METAVVSIVCIALIVLGGMTMSQGFLSSVDNTTSGLEQISRQTAEIARTSLTPLSASQPSAEILEVTLKNSGQTKLADLARWDFIVQYYEAEGSYHVRWLPYVEGTPSDNQWTDVGIYLDAGDETPEVFEPGILNPGEEMRLRAKVDPPPGSGTTNLVVIATPNGVPASISFTGYSP